MHVLALLDLFTDRNDKFPYHCCHRSGNGQGKKIVQGLGIVREFQFFSEGILKSSNGVREKRNVKSAYLVFFLYFYCFLLFDFFCTFNGHESCCIGMNIGHQRI